MQTQWFNVSVVKIEFTYPPQKKGKHQSYGKDWCQLLQLAPHDFLGDYWSMDTIRPIAPWTLRELLSSLRGLSNSLLGCSQLGLDQRLREMFRPATLATGCGPMPLGSLLFITVMNHDESMDIHLPKYGIVGFDPSPGNDRKRMMMINHQMLGYYICKRTQSWECFSATVRDAPK